MFTHRVRAQLGLAAAITVLLTTMSILIQGRPRPQQPAAQAHVGQSPIVLSAPVTLHE
jgi:hypothetical protein